MNPKRQRVWPILVMLLLCVVITNPADRKHSLFLQDQYRQSIEEARRKDPALRGTWFTVSSVKHYDGEHEYINRWVCSYTVNYDTDERATFGMFGFVW